MPETHLMGLIAYGYVNGEDVKLYHDYFNVNPAPVLQKLISHPLGKTSTLASGLAKTLAGLGTEGGTRVVASCIDHTIHK